MTCRVQVDGDFGQGPGQARWTSSVATHCCGCSLFVGCPCGLCLRFGPLFPVPSLPPLGCLLVFSGPVSLVVSATVRLSYLWYGASWLIGSCLHSAPWQQRLRPCVGLCPLHHVVGVVHVPLAPSLRYSPSCDPVYPSDTAKAARARLLGLCCFLPCPAAFPGVCSLLPCWSPLVSFSPRPRFVGLVCPPCDPLSWLVLVAPPSVCFWFVLLAWPVFVVCLVSLCCSSLAGFSVLCFAFGGFSSRHTGQVRSYILISPAQLRPLPIGLVCLSADWTGSLVLLTSPVHLVFALVVLCDYPQSTEVTKDGCRLLTLIIHTHPPL